MLNATLQVPGGRCSQSLAFDGDFPVALDVYRVFALEKKTTEEGHGKRWS